MFRRVYTLIGGLVLSAFLTLGAFAQQSDIEGTINNQFEAFQADDFAKAFTFATPRLQRFFQSPENFQRMVTQGYPMVWRPADVRYLDLRNEDGIMLQTVQITDANGAKHLLQYRMEQVDGVWRIGGVAFLAASSVAA